MSQTHGKIRLWFEQLKAMAFARADVRPTVPAPKGVQ